jgi:hypothetical protein
VLSQLAHAVVGNGVFYYVAIGSLLAVLVLSANTSFVAFPRLCRAVAEDGFLPKSFAIAGRRLVFTVGILYLTVSTGVLLLVFGGITDRLIPLFAIGAFLTFTLSQLGMVMHWWRQWHAASTHLWINAAGALTTAVALLVIIVAKFREGAWIILLVIPLVILLLRAIGNYYTALNRNVRDPEPLNLRDTRPPIVLVIAERWNRLTEQGLKLALSLSPDVIGVHLARLAGPETHESEPNLRAHWAWNVEQPAREAGLIPPPLFIMQAEYRAMHEPLLKLAQELAARAEGRRIAVLIPEVVKQRWYEHLLHTLRPHRLRAQLLRYGSPDLILINVPWYLDERRALRERSETRRTPHADPAQ